MFTSNTSHPLPNYSNQSLNWRNVDDLDHIQLDSWQICTNLFFGYFIHICSGNVSLLFAQTEEKKKNEYIKADVWVLYVLSHW